MRFKAQEIIRGVSLHEYAIDGEKVNVKSIHVDVKLDPEHGGKGVRTNAMKCESDEVIKAVMHNAFPMLAELDIEQVATGKKTSLTVVSIKPLPMPQAVKAA